MYLYIDLKDKQRLSIEANYISAYVEDGKDYVFMDEDFYSPEQSNGYKLLQENIVSIQYEPHYDDIDPEDPTDGELRQHEDALIDDFTTIFDKKFKEVNW